MRVKNVTGVLKKGEVFSYTADAGDVELQRFAVPRNTNTSQYSTPYTAEGLLQEQHYRGGVFPRAIQLHEYPLLPRVTLWSCSVLLHSRAPSPTSG